MVWRRSGVGGGVGRLLGGNWVNSWLMGEYHPNMVVTEKPVVPRFSKPIKLLDSLTKISPARLYLLNSFFCMAVQHHDWNLLNKSWLLIAFGVLSKVSLKVKPKVFKIQNMIISSTCRDGWYKYQSQRHMCILYVFLIHFLLLIIIYKLFTMQMPDKNYLQIDFCLSFYIF